MQRAIWIVLVVLLGTWLGCGPAPASGPRQTAASSRAFVGDAEVEVRYRYEPRPGKLLELHVDLTAKGADAGNVEVTVAPTGLALSRGELGFRGVLSAGQTVTHSLTLEAGTEQTPTITIVTRHVDRDVELSSDTLRFVVTDEEVRECRADDEPCQ